MDTIKQDAGATLPEWILLLPAGRVELVDRPDLLELDPESLAALVRAFRSRGVDLVIDYEHQSLQGRQAPAAGWIKDLEARADGLWARVEWTPQAREYLRNREYRYFSPVLQLDPETRKPQALLQVGLTNVPAIKRLPPLVAKYEAGTRPGEKEAAVVPRQVPKEEKTRKGAEVEKLKLIMGLPSEADDQAVWAKVMEVFQNLATILKLPEEATAAQFLEAAKALQLDTDRLKGVEEELRQLKSQVATEATTQAVEEAMKAGKIAPAQKSWALEYYRQDPGGFQTFVARAPQLVPTRLELKLLQDIGVPGHLLPEELALCRSLNLSPDQYLQAKARTDRAH
jgi:phage I-like protein